MSDRGMKKWNAYKALVEQYSSLNDTLSNTELIEKPELFDDEIEAINRVLVTYHNQFLNIKYWRNGHIFEENSKIKTIDVEHKLIVLDGFEKIKFEELVSLKETI